MANPNIPDPQGSPEAYQNFVKDYEFWRRYNDPTIQENDANRPSQEVRDSYRLSDYLTTYAGLPPPPPGPPPPVRPIFRPDPTPRDDAERAFLNGDFPEFMDNNYPKARWTGVRVLGKGTFGRVGHWTYDKTLPRPRPLYTDFAVKESLSTDDDLFSEAHYMRELGRLGSEHIVKLACRGHTVQAADGLGDEWIGKTKRLVMEYCSQGTLADLLNRRIATQQRFQENSLWMIFECLVDGISTMEFGRELVIDDYSKKAVLRPAADPDWVKLIHFDLKPRNMMLESSRTHRDTPIVKLGDFGLTQTIDPNSPWTEEDLHNLRKNGTRGFYAPEHVQIWDTNSNFLPPEFSTRWNSQDWKTSGVCGQYSRKTNIWGIGLTMYFLVMLKKTLDHTNPYLRAVPLLGKAIEGRSYGEDIESAPYSNELIELILSCLYEKPSLRPTIRELKTHVAAGIRECDFQQVAPEPWSLFEAPEPMTPAQVAVPVAPPAPIILVAPVAPVVPVGPVRMNVMRCSFDDQGRRRQCLLTRRLPSTTANPRCGVHKNLVKYPL